MIEAQGLVKRYGSTMAVNDLSFSIRPGMVTGFLGPNGARHRLDAAGPPGRMMAARARRDTRTPTPLRARHLTKLRLGAVARIRWPAPAPYRL